MCVPAYREYGSHGSLDKAKDDCYNQDDCFAVYDYLCDGKQFSLCTTGMKEKKSKFASCIYKKGYGKKPNILNQSILYQGLKIHVMKINGIHNVTNSFFNELLSSLFR